MKISKFLPILIVYAIVVIFSGFMGYLCFNVIRAGNDKYTSSADAENEIMNYMCEREKKFQKALKDGLLWYKENDSISWNSEFVNTREYGRIEYLLNDD